MAKRQYENKIALATKNFVVKESPSKKPAAATTEKNTDEKKIKKAAESKKEEESVKKKDAPLKKAEKVLPAETDEKKKEEPVAEAATEEKADAVSLATEPEEKPLRNAPKKVGRKKTRKDGDKQLSLFVDEEIYEWVLTKLKYGDTMGGFINGVLRNAMEADR